MNTSPEPLMAEVIHGLMQNMQISAMAVALTMIRFVVVMHILPVTSEKNINAMSRMGIAMMLAVFVSFGRPANELTSLGGSQIGLLVLKELLLGVILGFAMSTVFWAVEYAGALLDNAAGFNNVQMSNPMSDQEATPLADTLAMLAGAVFFSIGGAIFFAQAMFESFQVWPVADLTPSVQGAYVVFIERQVGALLSNALKLAAPILVVLLLIDVGMGVLSHSAEKLEPNNLAQPIKGVVTIVMVVLFVSVAFDSLRQYLVPRAVLQQLMPGSNVGDPAAQSPPAPALGKR